MRRLIGFALFCIATGMLIALMFPHKIQVAVVMIICMIVGYNLFSCK